MEQLATPRLDQRDGDGNAVQINPGTVTVRMMGMMTITSMNLMMIVDVLLLIIMFIINVIIIM